MNSKFIFVTGGVCSSLGKGIAAAALGCLLENRGLKVALQKMDPYINIDPGTMSPYQHGEVYVTDDGAETDLDLGNYERFTSAKVSKINSVTTGQIYLSVIDRERRGKYMGRTVQVIPHITNEIKSRIMKVAKASDADVVIVEIGGTVGDIESIPFLEAIRQFSHDAGKANTLYIHLTLVPVITVADEQKTKPTQHSVKELRAIGIRPDILLCRTPKEMNDDMKDKLSLFCDVEKEAVIQALDIHTTIYEVPIQYRKEGLDEIVVQKLNLKCKPKTLSSWNSIVNILKSPKHVVNIAVIGKYIELQDAYKSLYEAIQHGAIANDSAAKIIRIHSEKLKEDNLENELKNVNGIIIPGGFGERGINGKLLACSYGRNNKIPTFGICLGMQCMVIEFARNVCGLKDAHSTEIQEDTPHPVISLLEEQIGIQEIGGTMRLGENEIVLDKNSLSYKAYNESIISERHRHRYEFTNSYRDVLTEKGLNVTGIFQEKNLVEIVEIKDHPWYIGVQFHPEFKSKPISAHPLFKSFIHTAILNLTNNKPN
ncbi:MAG: CTP synthase [Spirochaetota bacterium]|nr:CTP synthase [Spirochaetota bacterium]